METPEIKLVSINQEEGYHIFTLSVKLKGNQQEYKIYAFDKDIPFKKDQITPQNLEKFAVKQMEAWITDSDNKLPRDKFRVLVNGGKIVTDNVDSFLKIQKQTSDLIRTNVTISANLFEWAKAKAQKENTSFSDLVSRGLFTLKDSDKEIDAWFKVQGAYFRKKLGDFGSYEIFHYLPNNYVEFDLDKLNEALQKSELHRTGWPIGAYLTGGENRPQAQVDGIKAEYSPKDYLLLDYWYAKNRGEFYFGRNLESDSGNGTAKPKTSLYFDTLIWRIAEALEHCLSYYRNLNIPENERVKLKISLYGLQNRSLSAWNPMRAFTFSQHLCGSDKASWENEITLLELAQKLDDYIYEATKKLLVMFDFFVPNRDVVQSVLEKEYRKSNM
jgi:hypothetical protein